MQLQLLTLPACPQQAAHTAWGLSMLHVLGKVIARMSGMQQSA